MSLAFCGTMLTPLLAAALVAIGMGAAARHVESAVMAAVAGFAALAVAGWWLRVRRG